MLYVVQSWIIVSVLLDPFVRPIGEQEHGEWRHNTPCAPLHQSDPSQ